MFESIFSLETLILLPWIILSLSIHEFSHAIVSYRLGDPTPAQEGRLSLNPLVHIDPLGLLMLLIAKIGWAKPVQINPAYYRNPAKGTLFVSLAGPFSNLLLALLLAIVFRISVFYKVQYPFYYEFVMFGIWINVVLAVFNLIPIPPLDGSKVLRYFVHGRLGELIDKMEPIGFFIVIALVFTGIFSKIVVPIMQIIVDFLVY
jgi:Zn-dependent protease